MQAAIKNEFGISANLKEGEGGIFEVFINGEKVYSNQTTYRFPNNDEIFDKIRERSEK